LLCSPIRKDGGRMVKRPNIDRPRKRQTTPIKILTHGLEATSPKREPVRPATPPRAEYIAASPST